MVSQAAWRLFAIVSTERNWGLSCRTRPRCALCDKTRPDRYFGIINMYPGKIYLVGGGVPLAVDGVLVGGVGVAGLPEGVDEKSARAGSRPG